TDAVRLICPRPCCCYHRSAAHRALHSFPTRRSSDLVHRLDEAGMRLRVLVGRLGLHQLVGEGVDVEMALAGAVDAIGPVEAGVRSEEHTSELQSRENLVCRLLLEKKKTRRQTQRPRD